MDDIEKLAEHRRCFVELYETFYGPWPAPEERQQAAWWRLVDSVPGPAVASLFRAVSEKCADTVKNPRLATFLRVWDKLRPHFARKVAATRPTTTANPNRPPDDVCGLCDGSGLMWYLGRATRDSVLITSDPTDGPLHLYVVPCVCDRGKEFPLHNAHFRDQVLAWRRGGIQREMDAQHWTYDGKGTPELLYALDMLRDSNRRREQPVAVAPAVEQRKDELPLPAAEPAPPPPPPDETLDLDGVPDGLPF